MELIDTTSGPTKQPVNAITQILKTIELTHSDEYTILLMQLTEVVILLPSEVDVCTPKATDLGH